MTVEKARILLVEDDENLGFLLKENFEPKGFQVQVCRDGEEGLATFLRNRFHLCILDVMLPKKDGFTLAEQIRRKDSHIPLIFLTAKTLEQDRLKGFQLGCDDYVVKPFSARELYMRIKAILKRAYKAEGDAETPRICTLGQFRFDYMNRILAAGEGERRLSTKEADLLKLFCDYRNSLLARSTILTEVWGTDDYFTAKSMDVYLTRLRKILKDDPALEIQNVHGTGYRLVVRQA